MASESLILAAGIRGIGHTRGPLAALAGTVSAIAAPLWPVHPPLLRLRHDVVMLCRRMVP